MAFFVGYERQPVAMAWLGIESLAATRHREEIPEKHPSQVIWQSFS